LTGTPLENEVLFTEYYHISEMDGSDASQCKSGTGIFGVCGVEHILLCYLKYFMPIQISY
jgi:hypothetical protein